MKLAYDEPTYERIQAALPPRYPDLHRVNSINNSSSSSSSSSNAPPPSLSTCFLETGPAKRGSMVRFEDCRDDFPTARALAEHAGPRLSGLCWGDEQAESGAAAAAGGGGGEAAEGAAIPRALLQLAPFPLAADEAALDEAHAPFGAAAVAWHERWVVVGWA